MDRLTPNFGGKKSVLNAGTCQMSRRRDRSGRRRCRSCRRSRYRGMFHGQTSTTLIALEPWPLQSTYQSVAKILGKETINVKRDGVIDHLQQIGQRSEHLVRVMIEITLAESDV